MGKDSLQEVLLLLKTIRYQEGRSPWGWWQGEKCRIWYTPTIVCFRESRR